MKPTGKTMVLSGEIDGTINRDWSGPNTHTILEYSNVLDITKAWVITDFKVWPKSPADDAGIFNNYGNLGLRFQLNTDTMPEVAYWMASENRCIAFGESHYSLNSYLSKEPFGTPVPVLPVQSNYYIQPDHIIQNRLDLACVPTFPEATSNIMELNYFVYLEEVVITPQESIVFNIKSQGQDLSD